MKARFSLVCLILAGLASAPAVAASGPITRGKAIAQENCGRCHNIARTGASKNMLAPPFRTLMSRYSIDSLEEALAEGIVVGHSEMPEFAFEPREISDLLGFIRSISRK